MSFVLVTRAAETRGRGSAFLPAMVAALASMDRLLLPEAASSADLYRHLRSGKWPPCETRQQERADGQRRNDCRWALTWSSHRRCGLRYQRAVSDLHWRVISIEHKPAQAARKIQKAHSVLCTLTAVLPAEKAPLLDRPVGYQRVRPPAEKRRGTLRRCIHADGGGCCCGGGPSPAGPGPRRLAVTFVIFAQHVLRRILNMLLVG